MNELSNFFGSITKKKEILPYKEWCHLLFIVSSEFNWTQKEFEETEIPYLMDLLEGRRVEVERQNKANRRKK